MSSPGRNFRGKVNADSPLIPVRSFLSDLGVEVLSGETGLFAGPRLISWKGSPFQYWVLKSIRSHPFDYLFLSYYINVPSSEIFSAVPVIVSAGFTLLSAVSTLLSAILVILSAVFTPLSAIFALISAIPKF